MNSSIGQTLGQMVLMEKIVPFSSKEDLLLHSQISTRFTKLKFPNDRKHRLNMTTVIQVTPSTVPNGDISQSMVVSHSRNFDVKQQYGAGHLAATTADTFSIMMDVWDDYLDVLRTAFRAGSSLFEDSVIIVRDQADLDVLRTYSNAGGDEAPAIYMHLLSNGMSDIKTPFHIQFAKVDGKVFVDTFPVTWDKAQNAKQDIMPLINHLFMSKDVAPQLVKYWTSRR